MPLLVPGEYFSNYLDTTSLALRVIRPRLEVVTLILDEMLEYVNSDGTIQVSRIKETTLLDYTRPCQR